MAALGAASFAAITWGSLAVVAGLFVYLLVVSLREARGA